ncbi:hypothetical protein [Luteibacter sp.]|uniref:hypothetical protein n=1 Tax=Luteibacter sp. TaxID=1886636 RepID=UPI002F3EFAF2
MTNPVTPACPALFPSLTSACSMQVRPGYYVNGAFTPEDAHRRYPRIGDAIRVVGEGAKVHYQGDLPVGATGLELDIKVQVRGRIIRHASGENPRAPEAIVATISLVDASGKRVAFFPRVIKADAHGNFDAMLTEPTAHGNTAADRAKRTELAAIQPVSAMLKLQNNQSLSLGVNQRTSALGYEVAIDAVDMVALPL